MKTEEIDIVLAWVDGSDPVWREKKKERMRQQGLSVKSDDREERYRDWDLMRTGSEALKTLLHGFVKSIL